MAGNPVDTRSRAGHHPGMARIELVRGDLTEQDVDVVVNAANSSLLGGGGVDGAIHRKGGPEILAECRRLRAAADLGARTVAFPAISAGIHGWPVDSAARIAVGTISEALPGAPGVELVRFVLFDDRTLAAYTAISGGLSG